MCYLEFLIFRDDRNDDEGGGWVVRLSEWLLGGSFKTASLPTIVSCGWDATHPQAQAARVPKHPGGNRQAVLFHWPSPEKLKLGKPRLGESTNMLMNCLVSLCKIYFVL